MSDHRFGVIVETTASPNALLKPAPPTAVKLTDRFWAPRLRVNREITLPTQRHEIKTLRLEKGATALDEVNMLEEAKK